MTIGRLPGMGANHDVSRRFAPDFTTESTEITETDRKEGGKEGRKKGFGSGSEPFSFRPLWPLCSLW
jgi:hypothetical protein